MQLKTTQVTRQLYSHRSGGCPAPVRDIPVCGTENGGVRTRTVYLKITHCPCLLLFAWLIQIGTVFKSFLTNLSTIVFWVFFLIMWMLLNDKIPSSEIRKRTKITDIIEYTLKQKWRWAGHIAKMKDNRWTTEWRPRRGKRWRGRPSRRWQDDKTRKEGTTWVRKSNRQTTMEDTDGELHLAVDGQSLFEDEDECCLDL